MSLFVVVPATFGHDTAEIIEVASHHLCAAGAMGADLLDVGLEKERSPSIKKDNRYLYII